MLMFFMFDFLFSLSWSIGGSRLLRMLVPLAQPCGTMLNLQRPGW